MTTTNNFHHYRTTLFSPQLLAGLILVTLLTTHRSYGEPFSLSVTGRMIHAPALVANELGFWQDLDIDIRVGIAADDEALFNGVRNRFSNTGRHAIDFGTCRAGDLAYLRASGLQIEPIAVIASDHGHTQLIIQKRIASVADLRNQRIGCDLETANLRFLSHVLKKAGLSLEDVDVVDQRGMNNPRPFLLDEIDAIVINTVGAADCIKDDGIVAATTDESPIQHVLFAKSWLRTREPELIAKLQDGYQKAQDWMRNSANAEQLATIIDKHYYWIKYKRNAKPLGPEFVQYRLAGYQLRESIAVDNVFNMQMKRITKFFAKRAVALRTGELKLTEDRRPTPTTGSAFDNAVAWWRFADPNDLQNYGTAGATLDLVARGSEPRLDLWGISTGDYYHRDQTWMFRGFQNDGYGWANDGVAKFLTTRPEPEVDLFSGNFTIWLRCSNRNTKNTILLGQGKIGSEHGFSVVYERTAPKPTIVFHVHAAGEHSLRLAGLPLQTYLDIAFRYSSTDHQLHGIAYETQSGKRVASGERTVPSTVLKPSKQPLTLGVNVENNTNMPLHGAIENVAVWSHLLSDCQIADLTRGPDDALRHKVTQNASERRTNSSLARRVNVDSKQENVRQVSKLSEQDAIPVPRPTVLWHNVKDYGAIGNGKHDDTNALQAAVDACIVPITIKDPKTGRWHGLPDRPPRPGHRYAGTVFLPAGVYRTTRPLALKPNIRIVGDESIRPFIDCQADVGIVFWNGDWNDTGVNGGLQGVGVTLRNLSVRVNRFALHTMGVGANSLQMKNCRFEGVEAGFVCTGFMMFSAISDCQLEPSFWMLTRRGNRFNTSTIERITIGLHGTKYDKWAMRLEGCIQCVRLLEITLEVRSRGIYLDSYAAGVTIDINNVWNFDAHGLGVPEVMRIVNGKGISVRNVMALDHPATLFVGETVRNIKLENILAKSITIENPESTKPVFSNVPNQKLRGDGSVIEDDIGGVKATTAGQ